MKYIKNFESDDKILEDFSTKSKNDIMYLAKKHGTTIDWSIKYVLQTINYFDITEDQIHNLRLAVEYGYLYYQDYRDIISSVIHFGYIDTSYRLSESKFRAAFEKNFKDKIVKNKKPYPICVETFKGLKSVKDLNSSDVNDIIGEIPKEYPFDKKYVVGMGRYRGKNEDSKTLWEEFKGTTRESDFIKIFDEKYVYILTEKNIEYIKIKSQADKYNL